MKLKYYLRGLGLGIIFTTILMTIEFHVQGTAQFSDDAIIERAEELGMVMKEEQQDSGTIADAKEDETETEEQNKSEKTEKVENDSKEQDSTENDAETEKKEDSDRKEATDETTEKDKDTEADSSAKEENKKDETKAPAAEEAVQQPADVSFTVNSGEFSDAVSQNLFNNGLVDDAAAFNSYIIENHYDVMLQPGVYTIPSGSDYDQIAKILTGKQ